LNFNGTYESITFWTIQIPQANVKRGSTEKYIFIRKNNPDKRIHNSNSEKETKNSSLRTRGGGGGHTSILEKPSYDQKEPENDADTISFIPKGAQMHTKNLGHSST
jgi:hypothetical protein